MLPDYVDTKQRLQDVLNRWLRRRVRERLGPLGEIPRYAVFEGKATSIIRPEGQEDITAMRLVESEFSVNFDEVPSLTLPGVLERLDQVAQEMADNMAKHMYSVISEVTERVGNVVRGSGKLTPDIILEVLEKIEIPFDENGKARMPSIHIHPDAAETISESLARLQQEPQYRRRFHEIMTGKERRWRARETDRNLAG